MSKAGLSKGHVHFGGEETTPRDNSILVQEVSTGCIEAHLGFLQFQHNYRISLDIPKPFFLGYDKDCILTAAEKSIPNVNCKLISLNESENTYDLVIEFYARKEKLLKEEIAFFLDDKQNIKVILHARVLGPRKGTPLLKNGIKCIGVDLDEMSEASDWQGFD